MSVLFRFLVIFSAFLNIFSAEEKGWFHPVANEAGTLNFQPSTKARTGGGFLTRPIFSSFPVNISGGSVMSGNFLNN